MPRNIIGGKGAKKGKNECPLRKEIPFKTVGQEYGRTTKTLGNRRFIVICDDGVERLCNVRGNMRRRVWVSQGDYVLLGLRDYQDKKADIIHKYSSNEASKLIKADIIKTLARNDPNPNDCDSADDCFGDIYVKETVEYSDILYSDILCSDSSSSLEDEEDEEDKDNEEDKEEDHNAEDDDEYWEEKYREEEMNLFNKNIKKVSSDGKKKWAEKRRFQDLRSL